MINLHGLIMADRSSRDLRELVMVRTSSSLPFAGRYRLIDFSLSNLQNAGVRDVGVVMQRNYSSLLDHIGSGKEWDMSRKRGGLKLLPPFTGSGEYEGIIDALENIRGYIEDIKQDYVAIMQGALAASIDLGDVMYQHVKSGADVTAVCSNMTPEGEHHRFIVGEDGFAKEIMLRRVGPGEGVASLQVYVMKKDVLLGIIDRCDNALNHKFHRDGLGGLLATGGKIYIYMHNDYAVHIKSVNGYYKASMDMLDRDLRRQLFPEDRPVRTKGRSDVSTYYGDHAVSRNSLVADGCKIEGTLENCVIFRGVRVGAGAVLKNCIIMQDTVVSDGVELNYVISDKDVYISKDVTLSGSPKLPLVLPKGSKI